MREFSSTIPGIKSKDVLELMLVTQYFDLLRDVGANGRCNCVFTGSTDQPGDMFQGMRKAIMEGQSMAR